MSYIYERFGNTVLPVYDPDEDIGTGPTRMDVTPLPGGGFYDAFGSEQAPRDMTQLSGKALILVDNPAELKSTFASLRALRGRRDALWRRHGGTSDLDWCYARCNEIRASRRPATPVMQEIEFSFQMLSPHWFGLRHGNGWYLDDGYYFDDGLAFDEGIPISLNPGAQVVTLYNDGNTDNAQLMLTITAGSAPITGLTIEKSGETDLSFTGEILSGQALLIDVGARSVLKAGLDAYADFTVGPGQTIGKWIKLSPGANPLTIMLTGGGIGSQLSYTYYDGWE